MDSEFSKAARAFGENLIKVVPSTNPEQYNLYSGLVDLAKGLEKLEGKIDQIINQQLSS